MADPGQPPQIQLDLVVFAPAIPDEPRRILSLGEVKWGEVMAR